MKKILALLLAVLMIFSLTACSTLVGLVNDNRDNNSNHNNTGTQKNPALVAYLEKGGDAILSSMESSFATSSGMTCTSSIEVVGDGFEIYININEMEDVPAETKETMQDLYDDMDATWDLALTSLQTEIPELEYVKVYVCEKDGDVMATITMD